MDAVAADWSSFITEALGVHEAMFLAKEKVWSRTIVETYALLVVTGIQGESGLSFYDIIIILDYIRQMFLSDESIVINYCIRSTNLLIFLLEWTFLCQIVMPPIIDCVVNLLSNDCLI
ncbi:unnamed protein product [Cuscuta europaea]|uniref:Uncharacterized protein n=1 Tax=Cuscuta europaea TaxID=41803 RepID=A0A9P0ZKP7_CUSEU|nr:unnamed protein product [Cuscuta europaea]